VPGDPGSRWHTTYEKACAEPSLSRERERRYIQQKFSEFLDPPTRLPTPFSAKKAYFSRLHSLRPKLCNYMRIYMKNRILKTESKKLKENISYFIFLTELILFT